MGRAKRESRLMLGALAQHCGFALFGLPRIERGEDTNCELPRVVRGSGDLAMASLGNDEHKPAADFDARRFLRKITTVQLALHATERFGSETTKWGAGKAFPINGRPE